MSLFVVFHGVMAADYLLTNYLSSKLDLFSFYRRVSSFFRAELVLKWAHGTSERVCSRSHQRFRWPVAVRPLIQRYSVWCRLRIEVTLSVSAAQHEAERESRLCDEKDQIWLQRAGLAKGGPPARLCVFVWGNSGPPACCLRSPDRSTVGALLHQHHSGGAVRSEGWASTICSTSRRPSQVNM